MDKASVDFEALYRSNNAVAFLVTQVKNTMRYNVVESNFDIDEITGLRIDRVVELAVPKSKRL